MLTGNLDAAAAVLESSVQGAVETTDLDDRFQFYLAAMLLGRRLGAEERALDVRLPDAIPGEGCDAKRLACFESQASALADTFDARNGNSTYRQRFEESLELLETLARPYPLSRASSETE